MNNYLILRSENSPYNDVVKSSVLSFAEMDNNLIFLKGLAIYTAITNSGSVTLKKYNGDEISFNVGTGGGTGSDTYWISGSTGNYSLKTINNSTVDATGNYSLAEGYNTQAIGDNSHAEGSGSIAIGLASHAEGSASIASGLVSHAEGAGTTAYGGQSHAEGSGTTANGNQSHAEGNSSKANGHVSHAEGQNTIAGFNAFNVNTLIVKTLEIDTNGIDLTGNFQSGIIYSPLNGNIVRYSYNPALNYFVNGFTYIILDVTPSNFEFLVADSLDLSNQLASNRFGNYSHTEGYSTLTLGHNSHAQGYLTMAKGNASHVGGFNSSAVGGYLVAGGRASFAHMYLSTSPLFGLGDYGALADYSTVLGGEDHYISSTSESSSIIGGFSHLIYNTNINSGIFAGNQNISIDTTNGAIIGGDGNTIVMADNSVISGGLLNLIDAYAYNGPTYGFIGGGINNKIQTGGGPSGEASAIIGGDSNTINGNNQYIGIYNSSGSTITSQDTSTIIGSYNSSITDFNNALVGHNNAIINAGDSVIGTYDGSHANIMGGSNNSIIQNVAGVNEPNFTSILNGFGNTILDSDTAVILNGFQNTISVGSKQSTIINGQNHSITSSQFSAILGGNNNEMTDTDGSALIGGSDNRILSDGNLAFTRYYNAILGGTGNTIDNGELSFIMGGYQNVIPYGTVGSVILGGDSITATTNNTVFVQRLNIKYAQVDNLTTKILTVDNTGLVKYRDISSLTGGTGNSGTSVDLYWSSGTTGLNSVKTNNNTTTDSTADYALAEGYNTLASGIYSHSEGHGTESRGQSSHAQNEDTLAKGDYSHAGGFASIASGITSFVHSYQSTAFGDRTVVLGGSNIAGNNNDTVYVPYLNVQSATTDNTLTNLMVKDADGSVKLKTVTSLGIQDTLITGGTYTAGTTTFTNNTGGTFNINGYYTGTTNLGNILFVSPYGNDSSGVKGYIDKPYLTLKGARDAATSGDTIHVFPQTFIFDNRNSNSNFWNGKQADINLWKNGVTYFFEPNCKIKFYNQTVSGQDLYLINPTTTTGETCTVLGYLEYEQYCIGADSSNGGNRFYYDSSSNQHTFYAQAKSLYSEHCEFITIFRASVGTTESNITIITDSEIRKYVAGQSSSGTAVFIGGIPNGTTDDSSLNITLYSKYRNVIDSYSLYVYGNLNGSSININGEVSVIRNQGGLLRKGKFTLNYNIDKTYITRAQSGLLGGFFSSNELNNSIINIKGDVIDNQYNSETNGVIQIGNISHNNTVNFDGNITTKTISGIGRFIAITDGVVTGNTINIKGDINYIGSGVTTQNTFRTNGGSGNTINYSGKITGNFAGAIASCYKGTININNSYIKSTIDGVSSLIVLNGGTSLGTIRINNSYIELKNSTNFISNGSYVNNYINNSTIINSAGSGLSNTTSFGLLQVLNSTIITTGTSINYTSSASVISSNSTTNNTYNINTLYGDISTITEITF